MECTFQVGLLDNDKYFIVNNHATNLQFVKIRGRDNDCKLKEEQNTNIDFRKKENERYNLVFPFSIVCQAVLHFSK